MCSHSREVGKNKENNTGRALIKASHTISIKPNTAINEIVEPIEDKTFHGVYASG